MLYRSNTDGRDVSEELLKHVEHSEVHFDIVDQLMEISEGYQGLLVHFKGLGQPEKCDWTWRPIAEL